MIAFKLNQQNAEPPCVNNFVPEIILAEFFEELLNVINKDYKSTDVEHETMLYRMFYRDSFKRRLEINRWNFYENAKDLFLRDDDNRSRLRFHIGYPNVRSPLPAV